jgi:hypothetical protein
MSRHGKFDTVSLLHRTAHAAVWTARAGHDQSGVADHCLKRVDLTDGQLASGDARAAEELLVAAAIQQAMGFRSVGWAPIHDLGSNGTDAYYVTERFPRSAQTLVDQQVRLSSAQLRTIMMAVVDALIELEVHYGRGHGNLKPSNVLLGDRIRPGAICLTDPAASGNLVPSLVRAPDPRAIGRLLFALVTHRPYTAARWPVEFDADWLALGWSGRKWYDLCALLLHPRGGPSLDLDELMTWVVAIRPSRRKLRRAVMAAPAVAALVAVAYVGRAPLGRWAGAAKTQVQAMAADLTPAPPHRKLAQPPHPGGKAAHPATRPAPLNFDPTPAVVGTPPALSDDVAAVPVGFAAHTDRPHPARPLPTP